MAISIEILNGINLAVNQLKPRGDENKDTKQSLALLIEQINEAITVCLNIYRESGEIPPVPLAKFLASCEEIVALMGNTLDKTTRRSIKSVLAQARIFDEDLEKSLDQYNQKLLKALVLGSPIKSLFISSLAIKKVAKASAQLSTASQQLLYP